MSSWDQANRRQKLGFGLENQKENQPNYQRLLSLTVLPLNYFMAYNIVRCPKARMCIVHWEERIRTNIKQYANHLQVLSILFENTRNVSMNSSVHLKDMVVLVTELHHRSDKYNIISEVVSLIIRQVAVQAERPAPWGTSPTPVTSLGRAPETEGTAGPLSVLLILAIVALVVFVMLLGTRMRKAHRGKANDMQIYG